jgi:hypothetical protein
VRGAAPGGHVIHAADGQQEHARGGVHAQEQQAGAVPAAAVD